MCNNYAYTTIAAPLTPVGLWGGLGLVRVFYVQATFRLVHFCIIVLYCKTWSQMIWPGLAIIRVSKCSNFLLVWIIEFKILKLDLRCRPDNYSEAESWQVTIIVSKYVSIAKFQHEFSVSLYQHHIHSLWWLMYDKPTQSILLLPMRQVNHHICRQYKLGCKINWPRHRIIVQRYFVESIYTAIAL